MNTNISQLTYELVHKSADADSETSVMRTANFADAHNKMNSMYLEWLKSNPTPHYQITNECSVYIEIDFQCTQIVRWWIKVYDNGEEITLTHSLLLQILKSNNFIS